MTTQNPYANTGMIDTFTQAPIRVIPDSTPIKQIVVFLNGERKEERILPHALSYARELNAELIIVHTHKVGTSDRAKLYIKSVENKLKAQYDNIVAYRFEGTNTIPELDSVVYDHKHACVMMPKDNRNWLQRLWDNDISAAIVRRHKNLMIHEVEL